MDIIDEKLRNELVENKMAEDVNLVVSFVKNSTWSGFLGSLGSVIAEESSRYYLSIYQEKLFIFKVKNFFKYNGIDEKTIVEININDLKEFTINGKKDCLTEKKIKNINPKILIKYAEKKIVGIIDIFEYKQNANLILKKIYNNIIS